MGGERRPQFFVPALVLVVYERVGFAGNDLALLDQGEPVWSGLKLIQVAGRDGKKFQPLQQRVFLVLRFFKDAAIKREPGGFSIDVVGRVIEREA